MRRLNFALIALAILIPWFNSSSLAEERVQARIGIEILSKKPPRLAARDEAWSPGDTFHLLYLSAKPQYVYLIHTDFKTATLVYSSHEGAPLQPGRLARLPGEGRVFHLRPGTREEALYVLAAPDPVQEIHRLFVTPPVAHAKWDQLARKLKTRSRIRITDRSPRPEAIAGNIRGEDLPLAKSLQSYAGSGLLFKRFRFHLEN